MARPANQGCPTRYRKENDALRRLESAIDKDPNLTLARRGESKAKIRAVVDDLSELITISSDDGIQEVPDLAERRGRHAVGQYNDQKPRTKLKVARRS